MNSEERKILCSAESNPLCSLAADLLYMGHYIRGDVVIAPVAFEERRGVKTRPAVVIATGRNNEVYLCPVSSKPASDAPCVPISLDDFSEGGLDLFGESYVLTSRVRMIRSGEVLGKRGRLTGESITSIAILVPQSMIPDNDRVKGTKRSRSLR
jgi:mRNA interferase MazF